MGIANKYNRKSTFTAQIPEGAPFVTLDKLKDVTEPIKILTMWINTKSNYGDHPVIGTETAKVDLPKSLTGTVRRMIADDEVISAVNAGKLGFKVRSYHSEKYNKDGLTVDFIDLD